MAEAKAPARTSSERKKDEGEGGIEYVDMGDYTLEIDRRLETEQRRRIPKTQRDVALTAEERENLEQRIEVENEVRTSEREYAEADLEVPPLKEKREKGAEPESFTVTAGGEEKEREREREKERERAS